MPLITPTEFSRSTADVLKPADFDQMVFRTLDVEGFAHASDVPNMPRGLCLTFAEGNVERADGKCRESADSDGLRGFARGGIEAARRITRSVCWRAPRSRSGRFLWSRPLASS
jgi:hypothetical protein